MLDRRHSLSCIILSIVVLGTIVSSIHFINFFFLLFGTSILYLCCCKYFIHCLLFFIFSVSIPFFVCVILLILALFMLLLQKNIANLKRFWGVPIVVALEINIYNSPGHKSSIDFFPGFTTIRGIVWFGPTFCPWNVCPVLAYAILSGIYLYVQQCFFTWYLYRWNRHPCWIFFYPYWSTISRKVNYDILWEFVI